MSVPVIVVVFSYEVFVLNNLDNLDKYQVVVANVPNVLKCYITSREVLFEPKLASLYLECPKNSLSFITCDKI